tara:strand:- start:225 stop:488 length:264 start_codon:yes stop_codon:yes gene_type:complete
MSRRLTVHLANIKPVRITEKKKKNGKVVDETKTILKNTISIHGLKIDADIHSELAKIRDDHKIAKCPDNNRFLWIKGQEMYYVSNEK